MKIKEIGTTITGKTPLTEEPNNFDGDIMFITPSDIAKGYLISKTERTITQKGFNSIKTNTIDGISILVGCIGSDMGNVAWTDTQCATNQQINSITNIKSEYNPLFIYYNLSIRKKYFQQIAGNTTTPILPKSVFGEIEISFPNKFNQDKIANILSKLDSKIENNNRINAELEAMAKTIYDYWFLQYEFPNEKGKPYKSSGGKMIWCEDLKKEIPQGWEVKPLSFHLNCNVNSLKSCNAMDYINYLDTSNLTKNKVNMVINIKKYENIPSRAQRVVYKDDILYSTVRPEQEHYGIIKEPLENMIASTGFAILSSKSDSELNILFYMFITHNSNTFILNNIANSSVSSYPSINPDDILNLKIVLPRKVDKTITEKFNKIFDKIAHNTKENQQLASLRDFLLPLLMNRQVGFKEMNNNDE
ncbi:MAG: restriction endonuclease subunit S [Ruminococcus sp.]|jgi:type I restriction enzyme S subunit|nr:restriction endonuclease subunit S [Ruminococcus sp.]